MVTGAAMPEGDDLLTADKVAALLSVSVRTVRRYADSGRLSPVRIGRSVRYRLPDVERLIAADVATSGQNSPAPQRTPADSAPQRSGADRSGQDTIAPAYRVTPAEVERAIARTGQQYTADLRTMFAELRAVFAGQVAAQQETIAAQSATIAELRRRAEVAETALAAAGAPPAAPPPPSAAPTPSAATDTPEAPGAAGGFWQRVRRALGGE